MLQKLMLMTLKPERLLANLMCLLFEGASFFSYCIYHFMEVQKGEEISNLLL